MKISLKISGLLLLCIWMSVQAWAQSPQLLFDQANKLYQAQSYDSATSLYLKLIDRGYQNPQLYYNTGNAYYQTGQPGYAIYYYTKALQKDHGNQVIIHNLQMAQLQASNKIHQLPTLFFVRWWHAILNFFSVNTWLILSIVFFWILLFFLGWKWMTASPPFWVRWLWISAAILFCFFLTGATFSWIRANTHDTAIIVDVRQPLRSAPDQNSETIRPLDNGAKVHILDSVSEWKKIQLEDGTEGWARADEMKVL